MEHSEFEDMLENFTCGHMYVISSMDTLMRLDLGNGIMLEPLDQGQYEQLIRSLNVVEYVGNETDPQLQHIRTLVADEDVEVKQTAEDDESIYNDGDLCLVLAAFKLRNGDVNYFCVEYYDSYDM